LRLRSGVRPLPFGPDPFFFEWVGFLAANLRDSLRVFARFFDGLMKRIRGAGPTPPGTEYESTTIPLESVFWSARTSLVVTPG